MQKYDFKGPEDGAVAYIMREINGARPESDIRATLRKAKQFPYSQQQFSFFRKDRRSFFIEADITVDPVRYEIVLR